MNIILKVKTVVFLPKCVYNNYQMSQRSIFIAS